MFRFLRRNIILSFRSQMPQIGTFRVSMTVVTELAEEVKILKWIQCIQLQRVQQQAVPKEVQAVLKVFKLIVLQ